MSSSVVAPAPHAGGSHWGPGSVIGVITGSLVALVSGALALAGLALVIVHFAARDGDGYINSPTRHFTTPTSALTAEQVQLGDVHGGTGDWAIENLDGRIRVRAALRSGAPVFVGIARERDLDRYLNGVAHDRIQDFGRHAGSDMLRTPGSVTPPRPAGQPLWVASATGRGAQTAEWKVTDGRWGAVVMRADARRGVDADVRIGGRLPWLVWLGIGLLAVGSIGFAGGAALIALSGRHATGGGGSRRAAVAGASGSSMSVALTEAADQVAAAATGAVESAHPLTIRADLEEPLSRWFWLVKWALVIPHLILLVFLWAAFVVSAVCGVIAVVATGRYPRSLFDFNAGVMRWSWRVEFYANGAFATDRYPPFTLQPDTTYPADLSVPYPDRELPRLKTAFQWLLAVPHWLILGALVGGGWWWEDARIPGLLPILVVIAVVALLFTGRYPREIFRLVVGIHRWTLRVVAYAAGMRPEYPPFNLER